MEESLLSFIRESIKQGSSKEEVTKILLDKGWQMNDIEEGFRSIDSVNSPLVLVNPEVSSIPFLGIVFFTLTYILFAILSKDFFQGQFNITIFIFGELIFLLLIIVVGFFIKRNNLNIIKFFSNKFLLFTSLVLIIIPNILLFIPIEAKPNTITSLYFFIYNFQLGWITLFIVIIRYLIFTPFSQFLGVKLKRFREICLAQLGVILLAYYFLNSFIEMDWGIWTKETFSGSILLLFYFPVTYLGSLIIAFVSKKIAYKSIPLLRVYRFIFLTLLIILFSISLLSRHLGFFTVNPEADIRLRVPGGILYDYHICSCFGKRVEDPYISPYNEANRTGFCYGIAKCIDKPYKTSPGLDFSKNPQITNENTNSNISEIVNKYDWQPIAISESPVFYKVYFINENDGFLLSLKGDIYKTTDKGVSWNKKLSNATYTLADIVFVDERVGYITGVSYSNGVIEMLLLNTADGGETWKIIPEMLENFLPLSLSFPSKDVGYFTGVSGKVAKFDRQTLTWSLLYEKSNELYSSIKFFDEERGYVIAHNPEENKTQLLDTNDGGITWNYKEVAQPIIDPVYFSSYEHGIAISSYHGLLKSSDSGKNWSQSTSPISTSVESIYFADNQLSGSVVTTKGEIFETSDGGKNWIMYKPLNSIFDDAGQKFLSDIFYRNINIAYGIDNYGQAYKLVKE